MVAVDLAVRLDKWEAMPLDPCVLCISATMVAPFMCPIVPAPERGAHGRGWLGYFVCFITWASLVLLVCWSTLHVYSPMGVTALPQNSLPLIYLFPPHPLLFSIQDPNQVTRPPVTAPESIYNFCLLFFPHKVDDYLKFSANFKVTLE